MTRKTVIGFDNSQEADAFADGMLYVNDSAIEDVTTKFDPTTGWEVTFEDTDYDEDDVTILYERGRMGA